VNFLVIPEIFMGRVTATRLLAGLTPEDVRGALPDDRLCSELKLVGESFGTVVTWTRRAPRAPAKRRERRGEMVDELRRVGRVAYARRLPKIR
jgi:hypothetical protein